MRPLLLLLLVVQLARAQAAPAGRPARPAQRPGPPASSEHRDSATRAASADRWVRGVRPVLWSNDYGGVTVGVGARPMCSEAPPRGLVVASAATNGNAASAVGLYARWSTGPTKAASRRVVTSAAAWSVEGRTGVAISLDHALPQRSSTAADRHVGLDLLWMATTNIGYVDRRLWDDAGSIAIGPRMSTVVRHGQTVVRAKLAGAVGMVYQNTSFTTGPRYHYRGLSRLAGEVTVRTPAPALQGTTFGARLFAGAYVGPANPVRQLRIPVAGADPYATFTNPFLRSRGALLVRPGFYYHAPGGANLRGFEADLGGRWAVGVNLELTRVLLRQATGVLREGALEGFVDAGVVDTLAWPSASPGRWYTTLYDGGLGMVTRHQVQDLAWTMRFEVPLIVNRWDAAADFRPGHARLAFRWQLSFSPSF
jgi:hypothetical protein